MKRKCEDCQHYIEIPDGDMNAIRIYCDILRKEGKYARIKDYLGAHKYNPNCPLIEKEKKAKAYFITVESCSECPNCRSVMDGDMNIWSYYCLDLRLKGKQDNITEYRDNNSIHPNCPLVDVEN